MVMLGVLILFLIPTYYIARSKGFVGAVLSIVSGILGAACWLASLFLEMTWIGIGMYAIPATILGIVWLMRPRGGAPGQEYLKIKSNCPECDRPMEFGREFEGRAELCPRCGALINVPEDEYSPEALHRRTVPQPAADNGEVLLEQFVQPERAYALRAVLVNSGIECRVIEGGAAFPLGVAEGHRVMIDAKDWEQGQTVLSREGADYALPDDFIPPPSEEELVSDSSRAAVIVFGVIVYLITMPFVILYAVQPFVRHAFDLHQAFTFTVLTAGLFAVIAAVACAGRRKSTSA